ncbi:MAG: hypothetical protein H0X03_01900 [Nitrosopumilus sp.]|nr:hypothetical protein [Nitrosopumilus sp.]
MIRSWQLFTKKLGFNIADHDEYIGMTENPLVHSPLWWIELYQRIKLFPWWIKYNIGFTGESELKDKIISLASEMNLDGRWTKKIVRHAVSEFSKKGLGLDYYGYHNIEHELEATYFALLSANGNIKQSNNDNGIFTKEDVKYLFVSALFHDYDPAKHFDKPNEESIEWFLRNDPEIMKFIDIIGIDINVVIALIYRTAYPFKGRISEKATKRIHELLSIKGNLKGDDVNGNKNNINTAVDDLKRIEHYQRLGWFLSVCERMAGYALGDFEHANKLARSNAHSLGWHPSVINEESVKYFDTLKQEKEMLQFVLKGIPDNFRKNFYNNIESFQNLYEEEKRIRNLTRSKEISFECRVEKIGNGNNIGKTSDLDLEVRNCVLNIYNKLPIPLKRGERHFISSLSNPDTILITLRIKKEQMSYRNNDKDSNEIGVKKPVSIAKEGNTYSNETIVGYVKGGPIEKHKLRRGTFDENYGKKNTVYMEWICIKPGFWGSAGGHLLRMNFLLEAKKRRYDFITGYVHRNVIMKRISKGEIIQIVQKYDPDKLDYYRIDLNRISIIIKTEEEKEKEEDDLDEFATALYP